MFLTKSNAFATLLLFLLSAFPVSASEDGSALEKKLGSRFSADIDKALTENGIASVAVFGFISTNPDGKITEGTNGLLPNELARILRIELTNMKNETGGRNKYKVMPQGLLSSRKSQSGMTSATLEDSSAVAAFLGDDYDVMLYGFVSKDVKSSSNKVNIEFALLRIVNGETVTLKVNYQEYAIGSDPATLAYIGENFPPLFISRPDETSLNPNGMLVNENELLEVFIQVDGRRLPFHQEVNADGVANQLAVKVPLGAEYAIEIFDPNPAARTRPYSRLAAAVLVDGLGVLGKWLHAEAGPDDADFLLCENPFTAGKWVVTGIGEDSYNESAKPGKSLILRGWQKDSEMARAFKFVKGPESLAARTNQISNNLGVVTVVVYPEIEYSGKGEYGTAEGRELASSVVKVSMKIDPTPKQVVNIRLVPVDSFGNSGEAGENLQLVTR